MEEIRSSKSKVAGSNPARDTHKLVYHRKKSQIMDLKEFSIEVREWSRETVNHHMLKDGDKTVDISMFTVLESA